MSDELKPCPFCGCQTTLLTDYKFHRIVGQHSRGCVFIDQDVIADRAEWNTRAQPSDGALTNEGAEPVLSKPAKVGSVRFGKGIKERLVIEAAQRHFEYALQPEVEEDRIERLRATIAAVHAPAPASVVLPHDWEGKLLAEMDRRFELSKRDEDWLCVDDTQIGVEFAADWIRACLDRVKELNS